MPKTAFLVSFSPMIRVVVDVEDPNNLDKIEEALIIRTARQVVLEESVAFYLNGDTVEEITPDEEIPYNPETDETNETETLISEDDEQDDDEDPAP